MISVDVYRTMYRKMKMRFNTDLGEEEEESCRGDAPIKHRYQSAVSLVSSRLNVTRSKSMEKICDFFHQLRDRTEEWNFFFT